MTDVLILAAIALLLPLGLAGLGLLTCIAVAGCFVAWCAWRAWLLAEIAFQTACMALLRLYDDERESDEQCMRAVSVAMRGGEA